MIDKKNVGLRKALEFCLENSIDPLAIRHVGQTSFTPILKIGATSQKKIDFHIS